MSKPPLMTPEDEQLMARIVNGCWHAQNAAMSIYVGDRTLYRFYDDDTESMDLGPGQAVLAMVHVTLTRSLAKVEPDITQALQWPAYEVARSIDTFVCRAETIDWPAVFLEGVVQRAVVAVLDAVVVSAEMTDGLLRPQTFSIIARQWEELPEVDNVSQQMHHSMLLGDMCRSIARMAKDDVRRLAEPYEGRWLYRDDWKRDAIAMDVRNATPWRDGASMTSVQVSAAVHDVVSAMQFRRCRVMSDEGGRSAGVEGDAFCGRSDWCFWVGYHYGYAARVWQRCGRAAADV